MEVGAACFERRLPRLRGRVRRAAFLGERPRGGLPRAAGCRAATAPHRPGPPPERAGGRAVPARGEAVATTAMRCSVAGGGSGVRRDTASKPGSRLGSALAGRRPRLAAPGHTPEARQTWPGACSALPAPRQGWGSCQCGGVWVPLLGLATGGFNTEVMVRRDLFQVSRRRWNACLVTDAFAFFSPPQPLIWSSLACIRLAHRTTSPGKGLRAEGCLEL